MRCFRSTSPTVFTLFTLFLIKNASGTPILQDEQNLNLRIERAQPGTERGEPVVLVERLLSYHSKESESAPAAQTTGAVSKIEDPSSYIPFWLTKLPSTLDFPTGNSMDMDMESILMMELARAKPTESESRSVCFTKGSA